MIEYDVAVLGGGIFGCSTAKHLAEQSDLNICLLEKEYHVAQHQSGRNSGTLHLGVVTEADVEPGTQLSEFTLGGTRRMKSFCRDNDLPILERGIMKIGQTEAEQEKVREMYQSALDSGVDVELLESQEEIHDIEPHITGENALYSPESATVDTVPIVNKLAQQAYENGVDFYMGHKVKDVQESAGGVTIRSSKGEFRADHLVNTAGMKAVDFAHSLGLGTQYQAIPFRGTYYELVPEKRPWIRSNVYPTNVGESFQVGVHFTRRPDQRVIVGPTGTIAFGSETYGKTQFNVREVADTLTSRNFWNFISSRQTLEVAWEELNKTYRKKVFLERCQKLIPDITAADIEESYVGISHWLFDPDGNRVGDVVIESGDNSTHLLLPQPGFTSALPLGEHLAERSIRQLSGEQPTATPEAESVD